MPKILARQGDSLKVGFSLTRDEQLRDQLEQSLHNLVGMGVMSGGTVTAGSGFSATLAAGTKIFYYGYTYVVPSARVMTFNYPNTTVHVWARIVRTAAVQANRADLDTYTLDLIPTAGVTAIAPSADFFELSRWTTNGSGITSITDPPGKFIGSMEVDSAVLTDGTRAFAANQSMGNNRLTDLGNPIGDLDAVNKQWAEALVADAVAGMGVPGGVLLANGSIPLSGDLDVNGHFLINVPDPTNPTHVANKQWVESLVGSGGGGGGGTDTYLRVDGTNQATADLNMGLKRLINVGNAEEDGDAVSRGFMYSVLATYIPVGFLPLAGGTMTGSISMGGTQQLSDLPAPTDAGHATRKGYVDSADSLRLKLDGSTPMVGDLNLNSHKATGMSDPTGNTDGVNLRWLKTGKGQPIFFALDAAGPFEGSQLLGRFCCGQPVVFGGSVTAAISFAKSWVIPTATATCKVYRRTSAGVRTEIGTVVFTTSSTTGTISFPTQITFAAGDCIELNAPSSVDSTLAEVAITIAGELA